VGCTLIVLCRSQAIGDFLFGDDGQWNWMGSKAEPQITAVTVSAT
jgi:hypothetical protein